MARERAGYKEWHLRLSSKVRGAGDPCYFGRILGSPPGLPGGGMTGVLPLSGVGARISGSMPDGGHSTPSDLLSLSPSGSPARPTVDPSGAVLPRGAAGAQLVECSGAGGAVFCCGVTGVGGACANVTPDPASMKLTKSNSNLIRMRQERTAREEVPRRFQDLR